MSKKHMEEINSIRKRWTAFLKARRSQEPWKEVGSKDHLSIIDRENMITKLLSILENYEIKVVDTTYNLG